MEASDMKPGMLVKYVRGAVRQPGTFTVESVDPVNQEAHITRDGHDIPYATVAFLEPATPPVPEKREVVVRARAAFGVGDWVRTVGVNSGPWLVQRLENGRAYGVAPGNFAREGYTRELSAAPPIPVPENIAAAAPRFTVDDRVKFGNGTGIPGSVTGLRPNGYIAWQRDDDGRTREAHQSCLEHVPTEAAPVEAPHLTELMRDARERIFALAGNTSCPICRGPATELLVSVQCHASPCLPWVEPEPEVRAVWRGPFPAEERHFEATGRGHRIEHPLRSEAISMWRAKVRR